MSIPEPPLPVKQPPVKQPPVTQPPVTPPELPTVLAQLRSLGAPGLELVGAAPLVGGFWAEMWTLELRDPGSGVPARVVLRLAPDAGAAVAETAVQRTVSGQGYPTPRILASSDATPTTRFWSVMEHADGAPLLAGLSGASALGRLPTLARSLPVQLATVMARLHELDPTPVEHALDACGIHSRGVEGQLAHFADAVQVIGDDRLAAAVAAVAADRLPDGRAVVCHGDLHPFNVLQHGRELTVLDWTAACVADPAYDVAFTALLLSNPPLIAPPRLRAPINAAARWLSRRFVRGYNRLAARPVDADQLAWHTRLHGLRVLTELASWRSAGTVGDHAGHPWFSMEPVVNELLGVPPL